MEKLVGRIDAELWEKMTEDFHRGLEPKQIAVKYRQDIEVTVVRFYRYVARLNRERKEWIEKNGWEWKVQESDPM